MRRVEPVEVSSNKLSELEQANDLILEIRCDRIETPGPGQTKAFASAEKALRRMEKLIKEKTDKAYSEAEAIAGKHVGRAAAKPLRNSVATVPGEPPSSAARVTDSAAPERIENTTAPVPPWLAQGEPVRLDEARALAFASRRHPQPVELDDLRENWRQIREGTPRCELKATDAVLRPPLQRMLDRLELDLPEPDANADALLVTLALTDLYYHGRKDLGGPVIDYLVGRYGLVDAVEIYLAAQGVQHLDRYDHVLRRSISQLTTNVDRAMRDGSRGPFGEGEARLRAHLALAPEMDWQTCAERIAAALPGLHPSRRVVVAMLLPEVPALSNQLALDFSASANVPVSAHWLLLTAKDPAAIAALTKVRLCWSSGALWDEPRMVATVLLERGSAAAGILGPRAAHRHTGDALACIGTPEAVAALARVASKPKAALARFELAVERWPQAALVALSQLVAQSGENTGLMTSTLNRLLCSQPAMAASLRPWLDEASLKVIDRQLSRLDEPTEVADTKALPDVLANPPWLTKRRKVKATPLVLQPLTLAAQEKWNESVREDLLTTNGWRQSRFDLARNDVETLLDGLGMASRRGFSPNDSDAKQRWENTITALRALAADAIARGDVEALVMSWRQMVEARREGKDLWFQFYSGAVTLLPPTLALGLWNAVAGEVETLEADLVMATLGPPALPGLLSMVQTKPAEHLELALNFGAVELAPPAARAFAKLKSLRDIGRRWLLTFPEHAVCALIAPALGKAGEARDCAASALRLLQANGHAALLLEVARRYDDPAVVDALRAVLEESPLDRFPTKLGKLPAWWQPRGWRRPVLLNGKALPDPALDHLGQMLGFPTNEEVYAGIAVVKEACQSESLADFAWDVFTAWLEAGGPSKEGWGLTVLGLLGNDDTARRLSPLIRVWPTESAHARAADALDVLVMIGTDVALMLLNGIAQKVKSRSLQDKARDKINAVAEARGLSSEELEDLLAPHLGLDERGTLTLDYGPRAFKVAFDESLKPYVWEVGSDGALGRRLADLPKPRKGDDEAKAEAAVGRFKRLKKDARTIASQQLLRLEVAMCTRRRWTPEQFRLFLVEHPLVRHIVHRLVWGVYDLPDGGNFGGALTACFRVAEDGSFTDAEDDAFELPEGQHLGIGVPHALEISAADAAAFGRVFSDYQLLQPFAQIGRDTYTLDEADLSTNELVHWKGVKAPTLRVLGLASKGWRRGPVLDGGSIRYFTKPLGCGKVFELQLEPGIFLGMFKEFPEQTLGDVLAGKPSTWGNVANPESFSTLDPIAASELIRDMDSLRA